MLFPTTIRDALAYSEADACQISAKNSVYTRQVEAFAAWPSNHRLDPRIAPTNLGQRLYAVGTHDDQVDPKQDDRCSSMARTRSNLRSQFTAIQEHATRLFASGDGRWGDRVELQQR